MLFEGLSCWFKTMETKLSAVIQITNEWIAFRGYGFYVSQNKEKKQYVNLHKTYCPS